MMHVVSIPQNRTIHIGVSLDIKNYCTLRLLFDLSTLVDLSRRNLPEAGTPEEVAQAIV
ncbi:hypothetical protein MZE02_20835 [Escherichia coli]|nr:hypothetical protein [Escherichia coli]